MKLFLFLLLAVLAAGQDVTTSLVWDYDMSTTGVSGSTLTDQSGSGNNGTLVASPTVASTGITFNGSTQYVSGLPQFHNTDFTVIVCSTGNGSSNGSLWYEGSNSQASFMRMFATLASQARLNSSGGDSGTFGPVQPSWGTELHCYYLTRTTSSNGIAAVGAATYGLIDKPYRTSAKISGTPNFGSTNCTDLGAQTTGASCDSSHNLFFTGTMIRSRGYSRALTVTELNRVYVAIQSAVSAKGVFLEDLVPIGLSGPVYTRQGTVINPSGNAQEPSPLYDTENCALVAAPCFKMLFSRGADEAYAESTDAYIWSIQTANAITGHTRASFLKMSSVLYYAYVERSNQGTIFDLYSSTNGATGWTLLKSSVFVASGSETRIDNPFVTCEGANCYMGYESQLGCSVATSTDTGQTFTKATAGVVSGNAPCQGPWLYHEANGSWDMWGGGAGNITDGFASGANGLIRFHSSTFNGYWAISAYYPLNPTTETSLGDPGFVELNGKTYLYIGTTNPAEIKLFTAPLPITQLLLTGEGAITSAP